jgi:hypothetical protein
MRRESPTGDYERELEREQSVNMMGNPVRLEGQSRVAVLRAEGVGIEPAPV